MSPSRATTMAAYQGCPSWAITIWPTSMASQLAGKRKLRDQSAPAPADRRVSVARRSCRTGFARPAARSHDQTCTTGRSAIRVCDAPTARNRLCLVHMVSQLGAWAANLCAMSTAPTGLRRAILGSPQLICVRLSLRRMRRLNDARAQAANRQDQSRSKIYGPY